MVSIWKSGFTFVPGVILFLVENPQLGFCNVTARYYCTRDVKHGICPRECPREGGTPVTFSQMGDCILKSQRDCGFEGYILFSGSIEPMCVGGDDSDDGDFVGVGGRHQHFTFDLMDIITFTEFLLSIGTWSDSRMRIEFEAKSIESCNLRIGAVTSSSSISCGLSINDILQQERYTTLMKDSKVWYLDSDPSLIYAPLLGVVGDLPSYLCGGDATKMTFEDMRFDFRYNLPMSSSNTSNEEQEGGAYAPNMANSNLATQPLFNLLLLSLPAFTTILI